MRNTLNGEIWTSQQPFERPQLQYPLSVLGSMTLDTETIWRAFVCDSQAQVLASPAVPRPDRLKPITKRFVAIQRCYWSSRSPRYMDPGRESTTDEQVFAETVIRCCAKILRRDSTTFFNPYRGFKRIHGLVDILGEGRKYIASSRDNPQILHEMPQDLKHILKRPRSLPIFRCHQCGQNELFLA